MAARGPRLAWWVIPATIALAICVSMGVAEFGGDRYVEPTDLSIPAGYVRRKLERTGDGIDHHTLDRDFETLALWSPADPNRGGHFKLGRFVDPTTVDEAFVAELERLLHSRTGASFWTHLARLEKRGGHAVGVIDVTDGDRRVRVGTTKIGDDVLVLVAISPARDDDIYAPSFDLMLESVARLSPHRRRPSARELRQAALPGLGIGGALCLPFAFVISLWRRRAWERAQLDRLVPMPTTTKTVRPSRFAWPFFAGGLVAGCVLGAVVADMLHRDRFVDARDFVAPPGYVPEALYGLWLGAAPRARVGLMPTSRSWSASATSISAWWSCVSAAARSC